MPKGPRGEKRPADVIGAAVLIGRIAYRDAEEVKAKDTRVCKWLNLPDTLL